MVKIQFFSLFHWFFFFFLSFVLNTYVTLKLFFSCAQNNFYIEFIWRRACKIKSKSEFHVFSRFPGLQNLDVFLENLLQSKFWNHLISLEAPVFLFSNSLPYVFRMESRECWLDGFWSNWHSKMQSFAFLSCHYRFTNCCEILKFCFF